MTRFDYFRCDECGKILENVESSSKQLMYTLVANYDTSESLGHKSINTSYKAHFCSKDCLKKYVDIKVKNHDDLPIIRDGGRDIERENLGSIKENKER